MSKSNKTKLIVQWWDRVIKSDILPIIWGLLFVGAITSSLLFVIIAAIRGILYMLGVVV